jgi:hypothetical protein
MSKRGAELGISQELSRIQKKSRGSTRSVEIVRQDNDQNEIVEGDVNGCNEHLIEVRIIEILHKRKSNATCCPSEIPRSLQLNDWRAWMEKTREVAFRLSRAGVIDILQRGEVVPDLDNIRGPIRLRLRPKL